MAIALALMLAVSKAITGFLSGSLAVLGSAVDSMLDILASSVNFFMIRAADNPPDKNHPFGHGKFEAYSSFLQSVLIFSAGAFLLYDGINRLKTGAEPLVTPVVMGVMLASIVVSFIITALLRVIGERESSIALKADSAHYAMDLLTNSGVLVALLLIKLTGLGWIDAAIGIALAFYIMYSAGKIHWSALKIILDVSIPDEQMKEITKVLSKYEHYIKDYHRLRTRTDGNRIFADVHLLISGKLTLNEAHALCDLIESELETVNIDITIHPEPCGDKDCKDGLCSRENVLNLLKSHGIDVEDV